MSAALESAHLNSMVRDRKGHSLLAFPSRYVVLDLETTGLDPQYDDIIEVAAIRIVDGAIEDSFSSLVNPGYSIDEFIAELTGITDASGTRSFTYNQYGEMEGESTLGLVESSLAAVKDAYGRASGYSLQYGGSTVLQTGWGYDSAGRPSTVSLNAVATPFTYGYNAANGLLETLNYPNTLKRWYTLEEKRDLVVKMDYLRPGSQNYPAKVDYTCLLYTSPSPRD